MAFLTFSSDVTGTGYMADSAAKNSNKNSEKSGPQNEQHRRRARREHKSSAAQQVAPLVGIIMGSDSDYNVMSEAVQVLRDFEVPLRSRLFRLTVPPRRWARTHARPLAAA